MTPPYTVESDSDDDLRGWHELQAEDAIKQAHNQPFHRCPNDIPPCPSCQEYYDEQDTDMV